jgi:hypothetical protein
MGSDPRIPTSDVEAVAAEFFTAIAKFVVAVATPTVARVS